MKFLFTCLLLFYAFIIIYWMLTSSWVSPYKFYLLFGQKGTGKSTYLVKMGCKYMKKGWNVYAINFPSLSLPGVRHISWEDFGDFRPDYHSVVLIDEFSLIANNRDFKKWQHCKTKLLQQQRKYKLIIYAASVSVDVDLKARLMADSLYLHREFLRVFSIGRRILKTQDLAESKEDSNDQIVDKLKWGLFVTWTVTFIPKYAKYFDSFDADPLPPIVYDEVPITENSPRWIRKQFAKRVGKSLSAYTESLHKDCDPVTESSPISFPSEAKAND